VVNISPESVVNFDWNHWSAWAGKRSLDTPLA